MSYFFIVDSILPFIWIKTYLRIVQLLYDVSNTFDVRSNYHKQLIIHGSFPFLLFDHQCQLVVHLHIHITTLDEKTNRGKHSVIELLVCVMIWINYQTVVFPVHQYVQTITPHHKPPGSSLELLQLSYARGRITGITFQIPPFFG